MGPKEKEEQLPPYVSYKTWNTFLEKLKGQVPLPTRMDSSFWSRLPFSGSNQSALKGALVHFSLLDSEDHPQPELEELVEAEDAKRQTLLKDIFNRSYRELLDQIHLPRATIGQLRDYFKSVGAEGQIGQKCTTFFLLFAREVGENLHTSLRVRAVPAKGRRTARRTKDKDKSIAAEEGGLSPVPPRTNHSQISHNIDPSMVWLLQRLPKNTSSWRKEERDSWKKAFDALFDFLYPTREDRE